MKFLAWAGGRQAAGRRSGFTLIELLVVLAIVATLLSFVAPHYLGTIDRAKERVLRENLATLRQTIDRYHADRGRYPDSLDDLVTRRYLRAVPLDPMTDSTASWIVVAPPPGRQGAVFDVHSGATGNGLDGRAYADW